MADVEAGVEVQTSCFHCGAPAGPDPVRFDGKRFCCAGCRTVYEILSRNQLCEYYAIDQAPGRASTLRHSRRFEFLDDETIGARLVERYAPRTAVARFSVPQIHCSSCIWLLENLQRLDPGISNTRTEFLRKSLIVRFDPERTSLRKIVELLASLGYEPELNLGSLGSPHDPPRDRTLYLRLGVAAFCFGNIMLFSLPEYLSSSPAAKDSRLFFYDLNLVLAIPVVFYSSTIYFTSALRGLAKRIINIDVPIALGISIVFVRSVVEVVSGTGPGFFDSLTGLVFFLLVGQVFQQKTYDSLNFEREYDSYLPLAVTRRTSDGDREVPVTGLKPGDRVVLRNQEVLPADAVLMNPRGSVDYSFVTGEAIPVALEQGALLHAGGRIVGTAVEVELVKEVSQSSLAQIWDAWPRSGGSKTRLLMLSNTLGKYFTLGTLFIAAATGIFWLVREPSHALDAVTAVLIVACPCALSLAAPFAFGTAMRLLGRRKLFLKSVAVIESMARVDTVVLDKTGTLTETSASDVRFVGAGLSVRERSAVAALAGNSPHPLSRSIARIACPDARSLVADFEEKEGEGISGTVDGAAVRLGSAAFVGTTGTPEIEATRVHVSINGTVRGWFEFETRYREGVSRVLRNLGLGRRLVVLSGDGPAERKRLLEIARRFASSGSTRLRWRNATMSSWRSGKDGRSSCSGMA